MNLLVGLILVGFGEGSRAMNRTDCPMDRMLKVLSRLILLLQQCSVARKFDDFNG